MQLFNLLKINMPIVLKILHKQIIYFYFSNGIIFHLFEVGKWNWTKQIIKGKGKGAGL